MGVVPASPLNSDRHIMSPHRRLLTLGIVAAASLAACGDDHAADTSNRSGDAPADEAPATDAYCGVVLRWTVHELHTFDPYDVAALKRWIGEYREFNLEATAL